MHWQIKDWILRLLLVSISFLTDLIQNIQKKAKIAIYFYPKKTKKIVKNKKKVISIWFLADPMRASLLKITLREKSPHLEVGILYKYLVHKMPTTNLKSKNSNSFREIELVYLFLMNIKNNQKTFWENKIRIRRFRIGSWHLMKKIKMMHKLDTFSYHNSKILSKWWSPWIYNNHFGQIPAL